MGSLLEWAKDPWGQTVPIHIAWFLIWVSAIAGLLFLMVHATYVRYFAKGKQFATTDSSRVAARIPEHVPRHSLTARMFHWVMAAAMFTLLFTAFLPKVGIQFDWVTYHWICLLYTSYPTSTQALFFELASTVSSTRNWRNPSSNVGYSTVALRSATTR